MSHVAGYIWANWGMSCSWLCPRRLKEMPLSVINKMVSRYHKLWLFCPGSYQPPTHSAPLATFQLFMRSLQRSGCEAGRVSLGNCGNWALTPLSLFLLREISGWHGLYWPWAWTWTPGLCCPWAEVTQDTWNCSLQCIYSQNFSSGTSQLDIQAHKNYFCPQVIIRTDVFLQEGRWVIEIPTQLFCWHVPS